jgi:hypothetical protein
MIRTYIQMIRPANVLTAVTDVLAGAALVGVFEGSFPPGLLWLCLSTACLYAGGIVFNDYFDAALDAVERPERAIPSGKISMQSALLFGAILFTVGVLAALQVSTWSAYVAGGIVLLCLMYDKFAKHHALFGPLNMGLCRGVNLVLGMSIVPYTLPENYGIALFPVLYIAAITAISRGEVHGGKKSVLYLAGVLYLTVSGAQLVTAAARDALLVALPFVALHLFLIFRPLLKAIKVPIGPNIGKAVKAGVLSLIAMNAAWISVSGQPWLGLGVLLFLPISIYLAKFFAVT